MNLINVLCAVFVGFGYAAFGVVGNYSKVNSGWFGVFGMGMTTITVAILSVKQLQTGLPSARALLVLLVAGIVNGIAVFVYAIKLTDVKVSPAAFLATVFVSSVVTAPVLDMIINKTMPTQNQAIGYVLAVASIYFISR